MININIMDVSSISNQADWNLIILLLIFSFTFKYVVFVSVALVDVFTRSWFNKFTIFDINDDFN